jgi:hypothetical protein
MVFFINRDKTGLINTSEVIWGKYIIKLKGDVYEYIYFGGLLDLANFERDIYNKTISIKILGHSSELERYPAFYVSDSSSNIFTKIRGLYISNFISSDLSEEGIKSINYKPFDTSLLSGVEVQSVSTDMNAGMKILEFRYPNYFRWDNGDWTQVSSSADLDSDGNKKLFGYGSNGTDTKYAVVNFSTTTIYGSYGKADNVVQLNKFLDTDYEIWVFIENNNTAQTSQLSNQGIPTLQFDNGLTQQIKTHFQRIWTVVSGVYTEISDEINNGYNKISTVISILENNNDELIISSFDQFFGMDIILNVINDNTGNSFEIYYSLGQNIWSPAMSYNLNGLTEGTTDGSIQFGKSGKITWSVIDGWSTNNIVYDSTTSLKRLYDKNKKK